MRILLVEDEKKIASFIARGLKEQHYAVDVAHDGGAGGVLASVNEYDLVILDVMLPGGVDGFSLCQEIRKKKADTRSRSSTALRSKFRSKPNLKSENTPCANSPFTK